MAHISDPLTTPKNRIVDDGMMSDERLGVNIRAQLAGDLERGGFKIVDHTLYEFLVDSFYSMHIAEVRLEYEKFKKENASGPNHAWIGQETQQLLHGIDAIWQSLTAHPRTTGTHWNGDVPVLAWDAPLKSDLFDITTTRITDIARRAALFGETTADRVMKGCGELVRKWAASTLPEIHESKRQLLYMRNKYLLARFAHDGHQADQTLSYLISLSNGNTTKRHRDPEKFDHFRLTPTQRKRHMSSGSSRFRRLYTYHSTWIDPYDFRDATANPYLADDTGIGHGPHDMTEDDL